MSREADRQKIKQILTATIVSLCNNGMSFSTEMTIEGLLGITLDHSDVFLVNIHETVGRHQSSEVQTSADVSRPSISSTVMDNNMRHRQPQQPAPGVHDKMTAAQQQQTESLCSALQPYYGNQMPAAFNEALPAAAAGGGNRLVEQQVDWHAPSSNDGHMLNHSKMQSTPGYVPSSVGSQRIKSEPSTEDYGGYDESSGEVYYGGDGYEVKGQEGYRYDTGGGYYDQGYGDSSGGGDQFVVDSYGGDALNAVHMQNAAKPPAKRRKVQPAANKKPAPVKQCVPSPSELKVAGKSSLGAAGKSAGTKDVNSSSGGLIERALSLVHEGQLTAGVAIKLFGIPRSTFYKKLSMTNPRQQQQQQQQQTDNAFDGSETYGEYFSSSNNEWDTAELNCGTYFVNQ